MLAVVKILGLLYVGFGSINLINSEFLKKYAEFWLVGKRIYLGAVVSFLLGLNFLFASGLAKWRGLLVILGVLAILKAVFIFVRGEKKMKDIIKKFLDTKESTAKIFTIIWIGIGVLLVFSV